MKAKLHFVLSLTIFLFVFSISAQNSPWKKIEKSKNTAALSKLHLNKKNVTFFELNKASLEENLSSAKLRTSTTNHAETIVYLPSKHGELEAFEVYEAPVFSPSLAKKYPNIKSYVGFGINNKGARLRMSVSPQGIQTMISYVDKPTLFMQPVTKGTDEYVLYDKKSKENDTNKFDCATIYDLKATLNKSTSTKINEGGANDQTLQKFRIAISVTGEYTAYHGGTVAGALAAINATLSRVNEIFETDMAVTFELVDATQLIYTDALTDPYSDATNLDNWTSELQSTLTSVIGEASYDIGHLFGATGGGGNAACIGCVCIDNSKGSGYTSPANDIPEGDTFDLNFVAHEIGHQMGANHTWSYENEGTGVQAEPGSGSTIMAYAGVTDVNDIQLNSDAYFHYYSIKQILDNLSTKTCQTTSAIVNSPPLANAGSNYTIPQGTPYVLKGSATDADSGDNLTYCWEQTDNGIVTSSNFSSSLTTGSINRSLIPSSSPNRYIPNLKNVLNGRLTESNPTIGSSWESVSTVSRTLNWALTVRDRDPLSVIQNGQTSYDTKTITVDANSGPFKVTSQATAGVNWTPGTIETITWDVANTNSGSVNVSNVNVLLSTDGGQTYTTTLLTNTPNDGSENISVPFISFPFCRIMVEAVNNIFYSINDADFSINYTVNTTCNLSYNSPLNLNLDINDVSETTHIINVPDPGVISDVNINVDISHTYIDDLVVTITHPNGTTSTKVWNRNCASENNIVMTFDDQGNNINCNLTGNGNTYAPSELLDTFNGLNTAGNWKISVLDLASGDDGTLNSWALDFCTQTTSLTNPNIEEEIDGIKVFPNPNNGDFWIAFNSNSNKSINIMLFDIRGRLILNNNYPNLANVFREEMKLNGLQTGIYILTITDGNFATKKKIVIK